MPTQQVIFRQLLDETSHTYTYILADPATLQGVIIDPVFDRRERDLEMIEQLKIKIIWALETHVHADHITSANFLKARLGCRTAVSESAGVETADHFLSHKEILMIGKIEIQCFKTPGHTPGCMSYFFADQGLIMTGDTLLIRGCGRTDFQNGSASQMYHSIQSGLYTLPDSTWVFPGHEYNGRSHSTLHEEKLFNKRIPAHQTLETFEQIMRDLKLDPPARIKESVPANIRGGPLQA